MSDQTKMQEQQKSSEQIEEFKVVMIGESAVGKSAITMMYLKGFFVEDYDPTIDDKYQKIIVVDGKQCGLEIIDTAGQDGYTSLRDHYIRNGTGFILTYSVTDRTSFEKITSLHKHILKVKEVDSVPAVLVGNKCDLDADDRVTYEEGKELATLLGVPFFETSAKRAENIEESYAELVRTIRKMGIKKDDIKDDKKRSNRKRTLKGGFRNLLAGFRKTSNNKSVFV